MNKHPSADAEGCRIENGLKSWYEFLPDRTLYKMGEMFTMYAVPIFSPGEYNNGRESHIKNRRMVEMSALSKEGIMVFYVDRLKACINYGMPAGWDLLRLIRRCINNDYNEEMLTDDEYNRLHQVADEVSEVLMDMDI